MTRHLVQPEAKDGKKRKARYLLAASGFTMVSSGEQVQKSTKSQNAAGPSTPSRG